MVQNAIPNADFSSGLSDWECTPFGVSLVDVSGKRFVMLGGEKGAAGICSEAIEVIPGARYRLRAEKAIRGDMDLAMISKSGVLRADSADEVVPIESPVRIQATTLAGRKVGISRIVLEPVGSRLKIESVRSTALFSPPGGPFQIVCEVRNVGSGTVADAEAVLISAHHEMLEEFRYPVHIAAVPVGEKSVLQWEVLRQRRAVATYKIKINYDRDELVTEGFTLKHQLRETDRKIHENVAGSRRWFSVGSRPLRLVAHETDIGFGPMLVSAPLDGVKLGAIHQPAQLVLQSGEAFAMFAELKKLGARGVELHGENEQARWAISITPDLRKKGVKIDVALTPKRRLSMSHIEFGPFQTQLPMIGSGDSGIVMAGKIECRVGWEAGGQSSMQCICSPEAGLIAARTEPVNMLPGVAYRYSATFNRKTADIMRG
ncbi:MAG: hypothetical protein KIT74_08345 [Fimbriimonadales bacterium]|nr:hypothetical protein [Fimbriimonadales bacterium]